MSGLDQLEEPVGKLFSFFPYKRASIWHAMLFHPHETMGKELKNATLLQAGKDVFVSFLPISFLSLPLAIVLSGFNILLAFAIFFLLLPLPVISLYLSSFVSFIVAKALGGKASYTQQTYLWSQITSGYNLISIPFLLLSLIPCVGLLFGIVNQILSLYVLYLEAKAIRLSHGVSRWVAVIALVVPVLMLLIAIVVAYSAAIVYLSFLPHIGNAPPQPKVF